VAQSKKFGKKVIEFGIDIMSVGTSELTLYLSLREFREKLSKLRLDTTSVIEL